MGQGAGRVELERPPELDLRLVVATGMIQHATDPSLKDRRQRIQLASPQHLPKRPCRVELAGQVPPQEQVGLRILGVEGNRPGQMSLSRSGVPVIEMADDAK